MTENSDYELLIKNSYSIGVETASHQQVPVLVLVDLKDPTATV